MLFNNKKVFPLINKFLTWIMVGTKYMDPDPAQSYHPHRIYFYVLSVVNSAYFPGQVARVWPNAFRYKLELALCTDFRKVRVENVAKLAT
jgi:hypothetical protein